MKYAFSVLALLIISCSTTPEKEIPVTESEVLNEFIRQAPVQFIEVDTNAVEIITLKEEDIIFDVRDHEDVIELGRLSKVMLAGEQFYVWSFGTNRIHRIEMDGSLSGPYGSVGQGPGEFGRVSDMTANSENIFIADFGNSQILVYDHKMNYLRNYRDIMSDEIDANDSYLLYEKPGGFICDEFLVTRLTFLSDKEGEHFMPCIVPKGYQPAVYNSAVVYQNEKSEIAASFTMLPWISLLDIELGLKRTLIISDARDAEKNLVPIEIRKSDPEKNPDGVGGNQIVDDFVYLNNGGILVTNNDLLRLTGNADEGYQLTGQFRVKLPGSDQNFAPRIHVSDDGKFFGTTAYQIYQIDLTD